MEAGEHLGPYEIVAGLGAGGMGEVYEARDTRLGRSVAIKVLPDELAADPERLARFEQEARAAAALNHPHIAVVHDVGHDAGTRYFVQELLEGGTLGSRLEAEGSLPLSRALEIGRQVADALAAAHGAGIVHRDLKPENVFVLPDGRAKVLDFGLAKLHDPVGDEAGDSQSPTVLGTSDGQMLGTVGYMAPEQVEGGEVDARTDLFALGCLLYEMLSGRRAFRGRSVPDSLSQILHDEPEPIAAHRRLPAEASRIVRKCLQKDPARRYQGAADLAVDLAALHRRVESGEARDDDASGPGRPAPGRRASVAVVVLAAAVVLATVAAAFLIGRGTTPSQAPGDVLRASVSLPADASPLGAPFSSNVLLTPDAQALVYVARDQAPRVRSRLMLRHLDADRPIPIPGTEGAVAPFLSPDGERVGFYAGGALRVTELTGGTPRTIVELESPPRGVAWGPDDTLLLSPWPGDAALHRVPVSGGPLEPLTELDPDAGDVSHRHPEFLPDGRHALFTILRDQVQAPDEMVLAVVSLDDGEVKEILEGGYRGRYVDTGHLLYGWRNQLWGVAFDLGRLATTGTPTRLLEDVRDVPLYGTVDFDVAGDRLAWDSVPDVPALLEASWLQPDGEMVPVELPSGVIFQIALAPDGDRLALVMAASLELASASLWIFDIDGGGLSRIADIAFPGTTVWDPDGRRLAFNNTAGGISVVEVDDPGSEREIAAADQLPPFSRAADWSPDGRHLVLTAKPTDTSADIAVLSLPAAAGSPPSVRSFRATPDEEFQPRISPDGDWIAYTTGSGQGAEVWLESFPEPGRRRQVSSAGGLAPTWSRDGAEIFYIDLGGRILARRVRRDGEFSLGPARPLVDRSVASGTPGAIFSIAALAAAPASEGDRLLVVTPAGRPDESAPGLELLTGLRAFLEEHVTVSR